MTAILLENFTVPLFVTFQTKALPTLGVNDQDELDCVASKNGWRLLGRPWKVTPVSCMEQALDQ
jgi:hypothetical protein